MKIEQAITDLNTFCNTCPALNELSRCVGCGVEDARQILIVDVQRKKVKGTSP